MTEFLPTSSFFFVTLTLVAFIFASACQQRLKLPILNPILVSAALIIGILSILDIPNSTYQAGCQVLSFLLTPATICLAIGFYEQFQKLRHHIWAIVAGVLVGTVCSIGCIWLMSKLFCLDRTLILSTLPKSVTAAIGVPLSEEIGGIGAVTTAAISVTGILGNTAGPMLCRLFRLDNEVAQGVAFGTASHVIGTAKAAEMSELAGAVSSLSLTIAGIATTVALSFLAQYI